MNVRQETRHLHLRNCYDSPDQHTIGLFSLGTRIRLKGSGTTEERTHLNSPKEWVLIPGTGLGLMLGRKRHTADARVCGVGSDTEEGKRKGVGRKPAESDIQGEGQSLGARRQRACHVQSHFISSTAQRTCAPLAMSMPSTLRTCHSALVCCARQLLRRLLLQHHKLKRSAMILSFPGDTPDNMIGWAYLDSYAQVQGRNELRCVFLLDNKWNECRFPLATPLPRAMSASHVRSASRRSC